MKTFELHQRLMRPIILFVVIACSILPTPAQDKSTTRQKPEPASGESRSPAYDLEVKEGFVVSGGPHARKATASLANVIDAVRDRYPNANVVIAPGLANMSISDLKLRTSSISEELEAIRVASGGKFEWSGAPGHLDPRTGLPAGSDENDKGLFTLREPTSPESQRVVEAFNIGGYLQSAREDEEDATPGNPDQPRYKKKSKEFRDRRANEMLEQLKMIILDTISALHPATDGEPNFQFHRGANLLVIIGSRDALDVARKVVNALPGQSSLPQPQMSGGPSEQDMDAIQRERFRRRYGLTPKNAPGQAEPIAPNPTEEQFRRRYGLDPRPAGSEPGTVPAQKPQP